MRCNKHTTCSPADCTAVPKHLTGHYGECCAGPKFVGTYVVVLNIVMSASKLMSCYVSLRAISVRAFVNTVV